jgi:hypothetical protein
MEEPAQHSRYAKKSRPIIRAEDVSTVFDVARIENLAEIAKLPPGADMKVWAEGIREAALVFVRDVRTSSNNELSREITGLHRAAQRRRYDDVADLRETLSARAQEHLEARGERMSRDNVVLSHDQRVTVKNRQDQDVTRRPTASERITLPASSDLRDETLRDKACEQIERLCSFGLVPVEGRCRPSGKQSRAVLEPLLHAPEPQRNFSKREAERTFGMLLRVAWVQATGTEPARTAHHAVEYRREVGPFARAVRECLRLIGGVDADPVELINELDRRRRAVESAEKVVAGAELAARYTARLSSIKS